uniref:NADH dehydrogenase [ubiquinone] 1 beta subcomplex subunit 7 n=2 Tax=Timema TaxID=61471 RepID=A0A7R9B8T2_TIMSH|nr:unnamed protein product [Timema shepardi]CAD7579035.1 unnamed protein product [Timema californicum]
MGNAWALYAHPDVTPHPLKDPSFDPLYGFPNGRKPREMIATEEQMQSAKLPLEDRGYCAHKLLEYQSCRADVWPWAAKCHHEKHDYLNCEYEDYILRLKEYEREKRLLHRKKRIEEKKVVE